MMCTSRFLSVLLVLFSTPFGLAFTEIDINNIVRAGEDTTVQVFNDLSRGDHSFDAMFDSYRVFLSLTPPGWGSGPVCYLVNSTDIKVTSLTVQVPASVGPSVRASLGYSIVTVEFNQDPNAPNGPSGFEYSAHFDFVGGTGNWSEPELAGYGVGLANFLPCSAYDCARQCSQKFYPNNVNSNSASAYKPTYDCIAACPGVSYPPFDYGPGGPEGGLDGTSSDSSIAHSSTSSLAAAGGFTQVASSATCTGSCASSTTATDAASKTQASSNSSTSGTPTASLTTSASTPTASKSAAGWVLSPQFAALVTGFTVTFCLLGF